MQISHFFPTDEEIKSITININFPENNLYDIIFAVPEIIVDRME